MEFCCEWHFKGGGLLERISLEEIISHPTNRNLTEEDTTLKRLLGHILPESSEFIWLLMTSQFVRFLILTSTEHISLYFSEDRHEYIL